MTIEDKAAWAAALEAAWEAEAAVAEAWRVYEKLKDADTAALEAARAKVGVAAKAEERAHEAYMAGAGGNAAWAALMEAAWEAKTEAERAWVIRREAGAEAEAAYATYAAKVTAAAKERARAHEKAVGKGGESYETT